MDYPIEITLHPLLIGKRKLLKLSEAGIEFNGQIFRKADIAEFRYGILWVNGIHLTIGRVYCIDIKNSNGDDLKIRLKSAYGIRKKAVTDQYIQIVSYLYEKYFNEIISAYLTRFAANESFSILGVQFYPEGIQLNEHSGLIKWEALQTINYQSYYALSSKSDPNKYRAFVYLEDFNTGVLYSVSRTILKEKGYYHD